MPMLNLPVPRATFFGAHSASSSIVFPSALVPTLKLDESLLDTPLPTHHESLLIDPQKAKRVFGRAPGCSPLEFLPLEEHSYSFLPCHFGWQRHVLIIRGGKLVLNEADRLLSGEFTLITYRLARGWSYEVIELERGRVHHDLSGIEVGFSVASLFAAGEVTPPEVWVHDARLRADFRNVLDFSLGRPLGGSKNGFFYLMRSLAAILSPSAVMKLLSGDAPVIAWGEVDFSETEKKWLSRVMSSFLYDVYELTFVGENEVRWGILEPPPEVRLPLVSLAVTDAGELVVTYFNGRLQGEAGKRVGEVAEEVLRLVTPEVARGQIEFIGLGPAGNDTFLLHGTQSEWQLLPRWARERGIRPQPAALVIPSPH